MKKQTSKAEKIISLYYQERDNYTADIEKVKELLNKLNPEYVVTESDILLLMKYFNSMHFIPSYEYLLNNVEKTLNIDALLWCRNFIEIPTGTQTEFYDNFTIIMLYMIGKVN